MKRKPTAEFALERFSIADIRNIAQSVLIVCHEAGPLYLGGTMDFKERAAFEVTVVGVQHFPGGAVPLKSLPENASAVVAVPAGLSNEPHPL